MASPSPGVALINAEPSSTMYVVFTTASSYMATGSPPNFNYAELRGDPTSTTPQSFTYNASATNPLAQTSTNTQIRKTTTFATYAYVWINTNPTTNPNVTSDVVTVF